MPKKRDESFIESERADDFAATLEEATRSTEEGVKYFIEPAKGTLSRAKTKRHHFIFGRRGSGKSSLLNKLRSELSLERTPVAYIDLETFKGHSYPDVLISILIKTLDSYSQWFVTAGLFPASKQSFWKKLFNAKPRDKALDGKSVAAILKEIKRIQDELNHLLLEPEETERVRTAKQSRFSTNEAEGEVDLSPVKGRAAASRSKSAEREISDNYRSKKIELLHRRIIEFKQLFSDISVAAAKPGYLLLDDLYHIKSSNQAEVVDYFHRISKGTNIWLKIGTIKHRSQWYFFGRPPIGMKLGDDADEIDLDVTLEKYDLTKDFLIRVLDQFCREHDSKVSDIISDGARDRLVLASGGVARDFLSIVRRSIDVTRQRLAGKDRFRGDRISAEDVNKAAGELDGFKREDFVRDTSDGDARDLNRLFDAVKSFCIEKSSCNCFLVNKETKTADANLIKELVDLKFLHHVRSRVTVRDRPKQIYDAYMLDISQYSGERKRRNFDLIEFWKKEGDEQLRRGALVYI
jgi:GTPase SAR1 family protein